jgi:hypothetical protein
MKKRKLLVRMHRWQFVAALVLAVALILWRARATMRTGPGLAPPPGKAVHAPVGELEDSNIKKMKLWKGQYYHKDN